MTASLCESCQHEKDIVSGRGSRFLLCTLAQTDKRFTKYPPQPVVWCPGYLLRSEPFTNESDHASS